MDKAGHSEPKTPQSSPIPNIDYSQLHIPSPLEKKASQKGPLKMWMPIKQFVRILDQRNPALVFTRLQYETAWTLAVQSTAVSLVRKKLCREEEVHAVIKRVADSIRGAPFQLKQEWIEERVGRVEEKLTALVRNKVHLSMDEMEEAFKLSKRISIRSGQDLSAVFQQYNVPKVSDYTTGTNAKQVLASDEKAIKDEVGDETGRLEVRP